MKEASLMCVIAVCLLSLGGIPGWNTDDQDCIVHEEKDLGFLYHGNILAYVTPENPLKLFVTFKDHNMDLRRDTVSMFNDVAIHIKVLEGTKKIPMRQLFPIKAPEGWVTLKLTAMETYVSLVWVAEREEKPLLSLTLDSAAENFFLKGLFSTCSGDSPEWLVNENKEVDVKLDAENSEQKLEVMGDSSTKAYLKFSESKHDVPANTTLWINTSRRGSGATVEVLFKDNTEEWNVTEKLQSPWPVVFMGDRRGSTRLRLKRSASSSPSPPLITSPYMISTYVLAVVAVLEGVIICVLCTKLATQKTKNQGVAVEMPDEPKDVNDEDKTSAHRNGETKNQGVAVEMPDEPEDVNDEDKTSTHRNGETKNQGVAVEMPDEPENVNDEDKTSTQKMERPRIRALLWRC